MVSWLDVNQSIIKIKYLTNYVWHIEPQRQCHVRCLVSSCWRLFLNGSGLDHNRFAWTTRNFCLAVTVALVKTKIFWNTFIKYTVDRKESLPTKTQTLRYMFSLPRPQQLLFKYSNRIILKVRRVQPITYHHLIFILAYPLWGSSHRRTQNISRSTTVSDSSAGSKPRRDQRRSEVESRHFGICRHLDRFPLGVASRTCRANLLWGILDIWSNQRSWDLLIRRSATTWRTLLISQLRTLFQSITPWTLRKNPNPTACSWIIQYQWLPKIYNHSCWSEQTWIYFKMNTMHLPFWPPVCSERFVTSLQCSLPRLTKCSHPFWDMQLILQLLNDMKFDLILDVDIFWKEVIVCMLRWRTNAVTILFES